MQQALLFCHYKYKEYVTQYRLFVKKDLQDVQKKSQTIILRFAIKLRYNCHIHTVRKILDPIEI